MMIHGIILGEGRGGRYEATNAYNSSHYPCQKKLAFTEKKEKACRLKIGSDRELKNDTFWLQLGKN